MSREMRSEPRRRILKAGVVEFGSQAVSEIPCSVRNLSASGAALEMNSPMWFPDEVTLLIASDGLRKPCRVIWRKERRVGVAFREASDMVNPNPGAVVAAS